MGQGTRGFILVRPLTVKVKAYVQFEVVLIRVSITRELKPLCLAIDLIFLVLNRRWVVPLYREVNAQRLSETQPAYKQCPARALKQYLPYTTSLL